MSTVKAVMGKDLSIRYEVVNEKEAAAYVDLSVKCLQARRAAHKPPAFLKIGRSIRYRLADLDAFLDQHRVDHSRVA